jgi:hypothetical protein
MTQRYPCGKYEGEQGNVKDLNVFFPHKGAIMKWLVALLILFLAPGSVQGKDWRFYTLTDGDMRDRSKELSSHVSRFSAFANADVMNVQMDVRVFIAKDQALDVRTKGHCYMTLSRKVVGNMRDHIIYRDNGPELWFPHLERGDKVDVFIIWKPEAPPLEYTTTAISNTEKHEDTAWKRWKDKGQTLWKIPAPDRYSHTEPCLLMMCAKPLPLKRSKALPYPKHKKLAIISNYL